MRRRARAAKSLGLETLFGPDGEEGSPSEWRSVRDIRDALKGLFGDAAKRAEMH